MSTKLEERYSGYMEALDDVWQTAQEDQQFNDTDRLRTILSFLKSDRIDSSFGDDVEESSLHDGYQAESTLLEETD